MTPPTLKALVMATPKKIAVQHERYTVVASKIRRGARDWTINGVVNKDKSKEIRRCYLRVIGEARFTVNNPVEVDCSCSYFSYHLETALAAVGATAPKRHGGAYPKKTNPGMIPGLCVHLLALVASVVQAQERQTNTPKPAEESEDDD